MKTLTRRQLLLVLGALPAAALPGCDDPGTPRAAQPPVPIADGDECAVCGMTINNFPGPKGEAFVAGAAQPLKFCSTRDLFAWLNQPESAAMAGAVYVHDMAATDWQKPAFESFTDGRSAWYVVGHPLPGAMGGAIASFRERAAADAFAARHQARVLAFGAVTQEVVLNLE